MLSSSWRLSFEAAVAGDGLLHLVPEFLGVVLLVDIVEVPVLIHEPAAVDAEGVARHGGFSLLLVPLLGVAEDEPQTGFLREVDADGDLLIIVGDADDITLLDGLDLSGGEFEDVNQVTDVLADDRGGHVDNLVGAGVDLDEALCRLVVRSVADDRLAGAERLLLAGTVTVQVAVDQARMEHDVGFVIRIADQLEAGPGADGASFLVLDTDGKDRRKAAAEDVSVDIGGKVLDHLLCEPELLEDGVRDLVFFEFVT